MNKLIAIPALLMTLHANAECPPFVPLEEPTIPDGTAASMHEMYEAQVVVKNYVATIENYLACNKNLQAIQHNRGALLAQRAAANYNAELQVFREQGNVVATAN